jgi:uncharacterized protein
MDPQILFYVLAAALVLLGLIGVVLPALPGLPLVYAGMLLAAWADGFERIGVWTLVVLGALTALSVAVDLAATAMGAKRVGASRLALLGAAIGTVVGLFFSLVGAVIGELIHRRKLAGADLGHATKVGLGTWLGILLGVVLKLALAFAMIGLFVVAWFF